jgi:hypothetical protein
MRGLLIVTAVLVLAAALVAAALAGCSSVDSGDEGEIAPAPEFAWVDRPGEHLDLLLGGKKVLRYVYVYDTSTDERRIATYKPFHHVFDEKGEKLLTNGPEQGLDSLYPHHRGIFIGWNKLQYEGKSYDFWHLPKTEQKHAKILELETGADAARARTLIHWNIIDGPTVISEEREVTIFRRPEPTILLLEFRTRLTAVAGDVMLDGDPEHGGFQYRPHNDVAEAEADGKAQYLFHAEGVDPRKDKNLPWVAMSYPLNSRTYSVLHMNHPGNPGPTIYSAYRDYGRFGAFFKRALAKGETLELCYRILVLQGPMPPREELARHHAEFVRDAAGR